VCRAKEGRQLPYLLYCRAEDMMVIFTLIFSSQKSERKLSDKFVNIWDIIFPLSF
jgi:Na+/melibiose symporter-like transporter